MRNLRKLWVEELRYECLAEVTDNDCRQTEKYSYL